MKNNQSHAKIFTVMPRESSSQKHPVTAAVIGDTTLPNGLRILTDYVPWVQSVTLGIHVNAGSRDDPKKQSGLAHFIEHAVFKGTKTRNYLDIAGSIEKNGGYLDAYTTKEQTCIYLRCLNRFVEPSLDLLADLVCNPIFPAEEIEKEKEVVLEEISSINDTPEELVFEEFDQLLFNKHPLGRPILGTNKSVSSLSEHDLEEFMLQHYCPENMILTATGNVDHEELVVLAERFFTPLNARNTRKSTRKLFQTERYQPFSLTMKKKIFQAQIIVGTLLPRKDPLFYPLMVLNTLLGGGMSSLLNLELREKSGIAYSSYSSVSFFDDITVLNIYTGADSNKVKRALEIITRILESPQLHSPAEEDLLAAKSRLLGSFIMGTEKMTRRMSHVATDITYFGRYVPLEEKIASIEAVTAEHINEAAQFMLAEVPISTLVYKPGRQS
ncbi:peptidase M16 domain protein [Chlorobium phaeobacteroides DSM 266]|uniref:Peptidase M16 domain protein n=2 Tax=Chlorobium phaeobacteroides TaxID=1096 RepID=A1BIQ6_CHLPD|nr:peptidase M16 domain protein [Chlorobium phaeobacteroides DSM 266]